MADTQALPAPSITRPARLKLPRYAWLLLATIAPYTLAFAMHWDDRGLLWVSERFKSQDLRQDSIWLPEYRAVIDAKALLGMEEDEASDLTYNPQTKTLFTVMGKHPSLVELTLQGDVLRKIPLVGWANPEGVSYMENGLLAIIDERKHSLSIVQVDANTRELNFNALPNYDLGSSKNQNKGFEGIAWDPRNRQLVLGEERPPALFTWKSDGSPLLKGDKQIHASNELDLRNLSALAVDPRTGHTALLSADSHLLLELDQQGEQISFMTLLGGFNGLKDTIPRAEGVALDEDGNLYMVSEPNLFYRFEKSR
ncbi:SdiA-regulated domain-containing protein [Pseudomonas sp. Z5-35]|uniref:SdiA-regulated domain-containing protein n=1 Tax=unclassified Pseudomonas TaxID=196821 RepID=UPI003DAA016A